MSTDPTPPLPDTTPLPEAPPSLLPDAVETRPLEDAILPLPATADSLGDVAPTASDPLPRTRWAAIVWGVCFAALAWFGIWMLSDSDRHDSVTDWFASLNPGTITAFVLLTVGSLVLITGLVGLIRRAQRRLVAKS